ncbi:hypothetical protein RJ640_016334 [Escallonia rubra]|uniref:V-type proton ATPase subunit a n=1 Tax=Escallonia rubra TaxID=112253 RepID=A0AA88R1R1_9ASTE|nr:hypothetical protein RJ640_016334 [Escallonia rubra]
MDGFGYECGLSTVKYGDGTPQADHTTVVEYNKINDLTHKHRRTIIFFRLNHHLNKPQPLFNSSLGTVLEKLIQHWRFQFIPQFIFLNSLFGYLSLLIIIKWCTSSKADLYHVMIFMFLSPTDDLGENQLFVGQKTTQLVLLLLALVAVPWMLLPKPFLLKSQHEKVLLLFLSLPSPKQEIKRNLQKGPAAAWNAVVNVL